MFLWGVVVTRGHGVYVDGPETVVERSWSALQALNVVIGLFSSLAVNSEPFYLPIPQTEGYISDTALMPVVRTRRLRAARVASPHQLTPSSRSPTLPDSQRTRSPALAKHYW